MRSRTATVVAVIMSALALAAPAEAASHQLTTTLLLNPTGQPVGGAWQRWMNDSLMPTYRGTMFLDVNFDGQCGPLLGTTGCTTYGAAWGQAAAQPLQPGQARIETGVAPQSPTMDRATLLYEQGHVVDAAYLTDAERLQLLKLWGRPVPTGESLDQYWWQGEAWTTHGTSYPLVPVMGEWFSVDYALCGLYRHWNWSLLDHVDGNWPVDADGYPIANDYRNLVASGPTWHWHRSPATRRQNHWLQVQAASCVLIRTWIEQAQGSFS